MTASSSVRHSESGPPGAFGAPEVVVTGMGFCLPGPDGQQTLSREDFWQTISTGTVHIGQQGVWFGSVAPPEEFVATAFPEIPDRHLANYVPIHHYGLSATAMALRDAGLDRTSGDLAEAAVLTARATSDSWFDVYEEFVESERTEPDPKRGRAMFTRLAIAGGTTDLAYVQTSLLGAGGPCHTVSSGCASSAVALGDAHRLIATGVVDLAVVTGVDYMNLDRILRYQALRERVEKAERDGRAVLPAAMSLDHPMRPYDSRAVASNMANGATTLILESREHAARRGARAHVRLLGQAHGRVPGGSAMAADESGEAIASAAAKVLRLSGIGAQDVRYVNGGAEGNPIFHSVESKALTKLMGDRAQGLPVSVQEACFGHGGSALGVMGVAATALMMSYGQVCPTAGCEQAAPECVFDPVPGTATRPHDLPFALSFNYHVGTGASAILLQREEEPPAVLIDPIALRPGERQRLDEEVMLAWFFWELLLPEKGGERPMETLPTELGDGREKTRYLTQAARRAGALPAGMGSDVVHALYQTFVRHWRATIAYQPEKVDTDVVLLRSSEPLPDVLRDAHERLSTEHRDEANGWHAWTDGDVHVVEVEGDHLTLMEEPHIRNIGAWFHKLLDNVTTGADQRPHHDREAPGTETSDAVRPGSTEGKVG